MVFLFAIRLWELAFLEGICFNLEQEDSAIHAPGNCNRIQPVTRMLWISNLLCRCCIPLGLQIPMDDYVPMEYSMWKDCVVDGVLLIFPVRLFSFPALDRICGLWWITSTNNSALHISGGRYNTTLVLHGTLGYFLFCIVIVKWNNEQRKGLNERDSLVTMLMVTFHHWRIQTLGWGAYQ